MTFPEELEKAADKYFFQYRNPAGITPLTLPGVTEIDKHFQTGAHWAIESELVKGLVEAAKQAKKHLEPDLVEPGRTVFWDLVKALAAYELARKESWE